MAQTAKILSISSHLSSNLTRIPRGLETCGLCLNDPLFMLPIEGNKRKVILNRTKYEFVASDNFQNNIHGTQRHFSTLKDEQGQRLMLELKAFKTKNGTGLKYFFQASSDSDFRLNGQWVSKATIRQGDVIDFALTRFIFAPKNNEEGTNHLLLSKEIIQSTLPVLIEGETGTGKSTLAKSIHEESQQAGNFIHLNLSSFSSSLIESELFGHNKGAFTGALKDKRGAFVEANHGTLFLDEIDSLPKSLQTKLLLFLDDGKVRPVGGSQSRCVKTRIIAASGSDLQYKVKTGEMRSDFYHRLASGVSIRTHSLRERPSEIKRIIKEFSNQYHRAVCPNMIKSYQQLSWPGNIRQLQGHLLKKHIINPMGLLRWDESDDQMALSATHISGLLNQDYLSLRELKKVYSQVVLARCHHHYATAAKILKISVNTLKNMDQAAKMDEI